MAEAGMLVRLDLSRFMDELKRTIRGEIPYDVDYLSELVSFYTRNGEDMYVTSFRLMCEKCDTDLIITYCPECKIAPRDDCVVCDGIGGWLDCPVCDIEEMI